MTSSVLAAETFEPSELLSPRQIADLCEIPARELAARSPKYSLALYTPPGPVGAAYIRSQGPIDCIMGPGGSGKTVASVVKGARFSIERMPVCKDGKLRVKGTVVRDNYRSLYRTTLQTWFDWFPTSLFPNFFGGQDRPAVHKLSFDTQRMFQGRLQTIPVELQVDFFAIADINYELLFKSYETSWGWATEADGVDAAAIPFFFGRTERYPRRDLLQSKDVKIPRLMMADFNPPSPEHPLLQACQRGSFREDFTPGGAEARTVNFFRQPSGLAPDAENRAGKTRSAYEDEMRTLQRDQSRRMVEGLPGRVKDGLPVFDEEWNHEVFVAPAPLQIFPDLPIHAGFDQGMSPAAVFFQATYDGQMRVLAECLPGHGTGVERFVQMLIPILQGPLRDLAPGVWSCDPAGFTGADRVYGSLAWAEILARALGHPVYPAPSNEWSPRRASLALKMRSEMRGGMPCPLLQINPSCKLFIAALSTGWKYPKLRMREGYEERPIKNLHADIADAGCYGALGFFGLAGVIAQAAQAGRPAKATPIRAVQAGSFGAFD